MNKLNRYPENTRAMRLWNEIVHKPEASPLAERAYYPNSAAAVGVTRVDGFFLMPNTASVNPVDYRLLESAVFGFWEHYE